jgi:phage gpG-like protein
MATVEVFLQAEFPYKQAIAKLTKEFRDSVSLKMDVGKLLKSRTQETFSNQADPWGSPWKPSKRVLGEKAEYASYASRLASWEAGGRRGRKPGRPKNARGAPLTGQAQTLLLTGRLRNSFEVVHAGNEVSFQAKTSAKGMTGGVSNVVYFPTHQWGRPEQNIVARPMMPLRKGGVDMPQSWREDIMDVVRKWVKVHAA